MTAKTEIIWLNKTDIQKCKDFANKRTQTDLYEKRGGFKKIDIISGAMAEMAVYKLLKFREVAVKKPDFTIHEKKDKSFDADLSDGLHKFHVKGQNLISKKRYGASWIMQRYDPILKKPERMNYLVPCTVDTETGRVEIYGVYSIMSLVDNGCIGECKVPQFRNTKVALYLDQLRDTLSKRATWGFFDKFKRRYNG